MSDKLTNSEIDARREAFDKAGYWPNEVLWKVWNQAWDAARLANAQGEAVAWVRMRNGQIDWAEDCLHPDDSAKDDIHKYECDDKVTLVPLCLCAHPPMPDSLPDEHVVATLIYQLENNMSYDKSVLLNALRAHMGRK